MAEKLPIAVLISGSGTNLQSIIDAIAANRLDAKIEVVLSNRADAFGLVREKAMAFQMKYSITSRFPAAKLTIKPSSICSARAV